ncbi:hypothetical protein DPMN_084815 [Dreissena polymorpha]|uniref:Mab-21-like nucleotidyltransferase domain-containing protein n=1 Tax=Dreissena polymorpha TaxID=45954 RepID=A0A9D3YCG9_DREPO|nr:hypothetical protein DPMN_084815 [Dreissena polymorpha]
MTKLGYGEEIRRRRVEKYREFDRLCTAKPSEVILITAGSKAEGLTGFFENDIDILMVVNGVLCVETGINLDSIKGDIDLFRMDTRVYPGHCRLLQVRQRHKCLKAMHDSLCDNGNGDILLSSDLCVNEFSSLMITFKLGVVQHERSGPLIPDTCEGLYHRDKVVALRCQCPSIIHRWAARTHHWPQPFIVQKVVLLGAYVTPVGCNESEYNHMEWRICFNTGEAELVNNLNDTQVKVYFMLKMILKEIIKPNNKEITSYVLKNIILWQVENTPQTHFHARRLFHWLHEGLTYYMIPERNLMAACGLEDALQSKWVEDITHMMEEGPRVILRLENIRKAIVGSPEPMLWFSKKNMEIEMLQLEMCIRGMQCSNVNSLKDSDFIIKAIKRRIEEIMREVMERMLREGSSVNDLVFRVLN